MGKKTISGTFKYEAKKLSGFEYFKAIGDPIGLPLNAAFYRRLVLQPKGAKGGNAAVCKLIVGGREISISAYSSESYRTFGPESQFPGLTGQKCHAWRWADTEFQMLNSIHAQNAFSAQQKFTVRLFTERAPCASCSEVISQFLSHYTQAEIQIYHSRDDEVGDRPGWANPQVASRIRMEQAIEVSDVFPARKEGN